MYSTSPNLSLSPSVVEEWHLLFQNEDADLFERAFREAKLWSGTDFLPGPGSVMKELRKLTGGAAGSSVEKSFQEHRDGFTGTMTVTESKVNEKGDVEVKKRDYFDLTNKGQNYYDDMMAKKGMKKVTAEENGRRIFWYERA